MLEQKTDVGSREKLLMATRQILLEKGHQYATIKEIARIAGVNHGLVHHYFKSKEQLFIELLKETQSYLMPYKLVENIRDREWVIEEMMTNFFPNTRIHIEFHAMASIMPQVREALTEMLHNQVRVFFEKFPELSEAGARTIIASMTGFVFHYNLDHDMPLREMVEIIYDQVLMQSIPN